ncbi:hypothetical protein IFM89_030354 [Coptis chinensis]|uniref:Uncharacterized protein n=1 Tax=Coptis chinensis TaxID=261450 RepID=A0A835IHL3_9MAGN|nr:hypothetical protein IFM89_030354 [Coptis chinensis]
MSFLLSLTLSKGREGSHFKIFFPHIFSAVRFSLTTANRLDDDVLLFTVTVDLLDTNVIKRALPPACVTKQNCRCLRAFFNQDKILSIYFVKNVFPIPVFLLFCKCFELGYWPVNLNTILDPVD